MLILSYSIEFFTFSPYSYTCGMITKLLTFLCNTLYSADEFFILLPIDIPPVRLPDYLLFCITLSTEYHSLLALFFPLF